MRTRPDQWQRLIELSGTAYVKGDASKYKPLAVRLAVDMAHDLQALTQRAEEAEQEVEARMDNLDEED